MTSPIIHSERSRRILVIACGNTLRGDDGIGWYIGSGVKQLSPMAGLTVLLTRQLLPEHAEAVSAADLVVFVDCSALIPAGTVLTSDLDLTQRPTRVFTHNLDPASLLMLANDLYGRIPSRAKTVSVGGESFDLGERLTKTAEAALVAAFEAVWIELQLSEPAAHPGVRLDALLEQD